MKNPNNEQNTLNTFITTLTASHVNATISQRQSEQIINATDNSIYESKPAAVIYPKTAQAIQEILTLGNQDTYQHLHFTAKVSATGCNGQSLNTGIIIDISRYMHAIGKINNVSPADRATIGDMFSTDASGKGSMR